LPCLKKRDLLNASVFDRRQCIAYGRLYAEAGNLSDAIDFFAKAKAEDEIKALLPKIIEEGDAFLFQKIYNLLGTSPPKEEWERLGEAALKLGKLEFAARAFENSGNKERLKEINEKRLL